MNLKRINDMSSPYRDRIAAHAARRDEENRVRQQEEEDIYNKQILELKNVLDTQILKSEPLLIDTYDTICDLWANGYGKECDEILTNLGKRYFIYTEMGVDPQSGEGNHYMNYYLDLEDGYKFCIGLWLDGPGEADYAIGKDINAMGTNKNRMKWYNANGVAEGDEFIEEAIHFQGILLYDLGDYDKFFSEFLDEVGKLFD